MNEQAMTDMPGLVDRLRVDGESSHVDREQAADMLESQAREIAELCADNEPSQSEADIARGVAERAEATALMRAALGADMFNSLWGQALEKLGDVMDGLMATIKRQDAELAKWRSWEDKK